ncbi:phosphinothricin acetyltransferase [Noviherbaspirillum humi]|uniref:Phosphinothricin acetyltransferase n=1 Tax=Noviherbaspirillum humi TaxID=1688639 RepID=A0A239IDT9_9BURK|nr:arsinothricin resistance N-acetyltransferase ArsN1 family B [Noviherbaspirillum humi]SNS90594.1 phosphinothricin acetyltransferase [Noviherbaspirillum humi]
MPNLLIRPATLADAAAFAAIYNPYVATTTISFEEIEVAADDMARRIEHTLEAGLPWLVVETSGEVMGYAYASKWKERSAYRHSVESSIYLREDAAGKGLARPLYEALLSRLRAQGVHAVMGGITQPNEASVRFHERFGFRQVALFPEVGYKFGRWIDVGYWQLLLNR